MCNPNSKSIWTFYKLWINTNTTVCKSHKNNVSFKGRQNTSNFKIRNYTMFQKHGIFVAETFQSLTAVTKAEKIKYCSVNKKQLAKHFAAKLDFLATGQSKVWRHFSRGWMFNEWRWTEVHQSASNVEQWKTGRTLNLPSATDHNVIKRFHELVEIFELKTTRQKVQTILGPSGAPALKQVWFWSGFRNTSTDQCL